MPVHEEDLVFDEAGKVVHDVWIVQEDLVVDQRVDGLYEFGHGEERLSVVGCFFEVYGVEGWVVLLKLVKEVFRDGFEYF